jgi:hypothetical protein
VCFDYAAGTRRGIEILRQTQAQISGRFLSFRDLLYREGGEFLVFKMTTFEFFPRSAPTWIIAPERHSHILALIGDLIQDPGTCFWRVTRDAQDPRSVRALLIGVDSRLGIECHSVVLLALLTCTIRRPN